MQAFKEQEQEQEIEQMGMRTRVSKAKKDYIDIRKVILGQTKQTQNKKRLYIYYKTDRINISR